MFGFNLSSEEIIILIVFVLFTGVIIYFYGFSNKRLLKKISELRNSEHDIYKLIEKVSKAKTREHNELKKRVEALEGKTGIILQGQNKKQLEPEIIYANRKL